MRKQPQTEYPEFPELESINRTLDPEGDIVHTLIQQAFSGDDLRKGLALFRVRNLIADEIERLIDLLDTLEPDADLEPSTDNFHSDPRIADCEDDESELNEPSLGSCEITDQSLWTQGAANRYHVDLEVDISERLRLGKFTARLARSATLVGLLVEMRCLLPSLLITNR